MHERKVEQAPLLGLPGDEEADRLSAKESVAWAVSKGMSYEDACKAFGLDANA